jgi:hypothetical protein
MADTLVASVSLTPFPASGTVSTHVMVRESTFSLLIRDLQLTLSEIIQNIRKLFLLLVILRLLGGFFTSTIVIRLS